MASHNIPLLQCVCGTPTLPGGVVVNCSAQRRIGNSTPTEALKMAAEGPPNSCLVLAISMACATGTGKYNEGEFVAFSLELIQRSIRGKATPGLWGIPLHCLNAYLIQDPAQRLMASGQPLAARVQNIMPEVVDAIWRDRGLLKIQGTLEDVVRITVAMFLKSLYVLGPLKGYFYTDRSIDLIWICWLEMDINSGNRQAANEIVSQLLSGKGVKVARTYRRLLKTTSLDHVATSITSWLSSKSLLDEDLVGELRTIYAFFSLIMQSDETLSDHIQHCIDAKIHEHLCDALYRQVDLGNKEATSNALGVGAAIFMECISVSGSRAPRLFTALLSNPSFPRVISQVFGFRPKSNADMFEVMTDTLSSWDMLLARLEHATTCRDATCWLYCTTDLLDLTRQTFELIYHETAARFTIPNPSRARASELWTQIRLFYRIGDGTVRERFKLLKKCCNPACVHRLKEVKITRKLACSGCRTVFYCDAACQKADWKKHKIDCNPALSATHEKLVLMYKLPPASELPHSPTYI